MEVSALTAPDAVSATEYKRARMQTNTRRHTREKFRRYTHNHRQAHYEQDGSRSRRHGSLEWTGVVPLSRPILNAYTL
jgi:hypothetical protein